MIKYVDKGMARQHLTDRLMESALNNIGIKTDADEVFRDIAENRLPVWIDELPTMFATSWMQKTKTMVIAVTESGKMANTIMLMPDTLEEFMEQYKMVDTEKVYSNGTEYVPIFRMKQWFAHQADIPRWIPVTERLPEEYGKYLITILDDEHLSTEIAYYGKPILQYNGNRSCFYQCDSEYGEVARDDVIAWLPLPEPYREGKEQ